MRPLLTHVATLKGHRQGLYALAPGLDLETFFTSGSDGLVAEWRISEPDEARLLARLEGQCWALALMPTLGLLVVAQNGQGLHFIDLKTREAVGSLALGEGNIFGIADTPAGLAVIDSLGRLRLVDVPARRILATLQVSDKPLRCVRLIDDKTLALGGSDGQIRLLDLPSLKTRTAWPAHDPTVMTLCPLPGGRLASGGRDARIRTWDLTRTAPDLLQEIPAHHYALYDLALHPGGELLLSASMDKTLKLWDAATLRLLRVHDRARHQGHASSVNRCLWLNAEYAVSCSDDRTAILWRLGQG